MACSFSISSYPLLSTNVLFCIDENVTPFICRRGPETDKFSDSFFKILNTLIGVFFFPHQISVLQTFFCRFVPRFCGGSPRTSSSENTGRSKEGGWSGAYQGIFKPSFVPSLFHYNVKLLQLQALFSALSFLISSEYHGTGIIIIMNIYKKTHCVKKCAKHLWNSSFNSRNSFMSNYYCSYCVDKKIEANKNEIGAEEMFWTARKTLEDCATLDCCWLGLQIFMPEERRWLNCLEKPDSLLCVRPVL